MSLFNIRYLKAYIVKLIVSTTNNISKDTFYALIDSFKSTYFVCNRTIK